MKALICVILILGICIVYAKFSIKSKPFIDIAIAENSRKIQKVFQKTSTITVLLKNYEQPEGMIKWLESIFGGSGNKSFVVHSFPSDEGKREWMKECGDYLSNPGNKVAYGERVYQLKYGSTGTKGPQLEEFESELDPQAAPNTKTSFQVLEKFAHGLDKWWKFHYAGYIIFSTFYGLDYYTGCLFNRAGTFLFVIHESIEENENYLEVINSTFYKAWQMVGNIKLYILINKQILIFNPFDRNNDGKFGKIKLFDEENLFIEETLDDLNGYPMNIEMFWSAFSTATDGFKNLDFRTYRGPDADVAKMLTQRMNASIITVPNKGKFGYKYPNGTLSGALGNLQKRKSDIALTAFFMKDYETRAAEFTYPLYTDRLCVVVQKAGRIPSEMLPMMIFVDNLWIALFIAYILIAIIWTLLRSINNQIRRPSNDANKVDFHINSYNMSPFLARQSWIRQCMQIFVDTIMLFLSIPMRRLTRVQYERLYVSAICLVSIIFVSIYQSNLATVFVRPMYFRDIDTLEKLDNSINNILVKYAGFMTDVFPNDTSQLFRNLRNKMKLVETQMDAMDLVRFGDKVATVTRESTVWLDNFQFFHQKILYLIDKECPKDYFLAYMVPSKSPFKKRINKILMDIHRYGFIEKWINDFYFATELRYLKTMGDEDEGLKILTLNDLKFPFYALIGGNCVSMIVIFIEILIDCRRKRKDKKHAQKYTTEKKVELVVVNSVNILKENGIDKND
ncbi:uncharacterized protein [Chironomus tepperi]|uniref:uncharacterized protein n=1 Tax=Chironomus tepperi TaxID=113505 RepID=UPI00391F9BCC